MVASQLLLTSISPSLMVGTWVFFKQMKMLWTKGIKSRVSFNKKDGVGRVGSGYPKQILFFWPKKLFSNLSLFVRTSSSLSTTGSLKNCISFPGFWRWHSSASVNGGWSLGWNIWRLHFHVFLFSDTLHEDEATHKITHTSPVTFYALERQTKFIHLAPVPKYLILLELYPGEICDLFSFGFLLVHKHTQKFTHTQSHYSDKHLPTERHGQPVRRIHTLYGW